MSKLDVVERRRRYESAKEMDKLMSDIAIPIDDEFFSDEQLSKDVDDELEQVLREIASRHNNKSKPRNKSKTTNKYSLVNRLSKRCISRSDLTDKVDRMANSYFQGATLDDLDSTEFWLKGLD